MPYNESRHHFPMSSMLFDSSPNLRVPLPTNTTLVNVREAADTSITALPAPRPIEDERIKHKPSLWHRLVAKIKGVFGRKEEKARTQQNGVERRGLVIGGPTDFQHLRTGGPRPLMGGGLGEVEEDEWEDM
ncbi:hypothetical protein BDU57DRAFT_68056 [Ampelomyces quisqualis]|uniref:Uncharacterized protein n=1 Tax=Ampelomyces quisqualis TaxID=50730 RepID=A0A6A5R443_AMPQU|nr:hypothetical protein BDU57DRAFT_68056 [Ampelomyces quisqualis]